jgi:hypothetical protein
MPRGLEEVFIVLGFTSNCDAANLPKGLEIETHTTAYSCISVLSDR